MAVIRSGSLSKAFVIGCFVGVFCISTQCLAVDDTQEGLPDTGTHTYKIPNDFIPKSFGQPGDQRVTFSKIYAAFWIGALLPALQPAGENPVEFRRVGWFNQVTVLVEHKRQFLPAEGVLDQSLGWAHLSRSDYTQDGSCKIYVTSPGFQDQRECGSGTAVFMLTCRIKGIAVIYPSCTEFANITPDTTAIITYPRSFAGGAVEIDRWLRALIASFEANSQTPSRTSN